MIFNNPKKQCPYCKAPILKGGFAKHTALCQRMPAPSTIRAMCKNGYTSAIVHQIASEAGATVPVVKTHLERLGVKRCESFKRRAVY